MRILIINPNSDAKMTAAIHATAERYADGDFDVVCLSTPGGPRFIETYEDEVRAAPGMMELLRAHEAEFDGFVVACHSDVNLDVLKEVTAKPVVGIGEASMKMASMLGHGFSVVTNLRHSVPGKKSLARKYHLEEVLVSVRAPDKGGPHGHAEEVFVELARRAVEEDLAEVIVLGCAGLTGVDKLIQAELGVPALDGVVCALILVTGLVRYGVSTSKVLGYNPNYGSGREKTPRPGDGEQP